ncbi:MAG: D-alanyl-D-alanine carboxypeptidase [Clostridiales bacterium]|jgi:D-alanyl-D-alanine carboxypeptidase (penicillin-binding protein 5/6)|nr:D-alanyl-D-alanine carboxypeptidase [Clostridiales bacterium]
MRILRVAIGFILCVAFFPAVIYATPEIHAEAYILIEKHSGRILAEHEAHRRMFPAATSMILTAILAYEHIGADEIIVVGNEITALPDGSARTGHEIGEELGLEDLIRSMLVGRGLDAANTVALTVARRVSGDEDMAFAQAQSFFANLMNERARALGAENSRFMNPHGYHHGNHFSTAYDLAQISRHAMNVATIAEIAAEGRFRQFANANELIGQYAYATGIRTGFTNRAGESLAAAASRGGVDLIAITLNSPIIDDAPTRWQDAISLFEYGFENYATRALLAPDTILGQMYVENPRLGDIGYLEFYNAIGREYFLSLRELARIQTYIEFLPQFVAYYGEESELHFVAPIEEGEKIGTISHILDGETLYITNLYAARHVPIRDTSSDIDYHMERIRQIFFSRASVPYWIAALSVLALLFIAAILIRNRIRQRKAKQGKYKMKL